MSRIKLQSQPPNRLCLSGVDPGWLFVLMRVPEMLEGPQPPEVRDRLLPPPTNDAAFNEEWRELMTPEMEALWRSNYELMAEDIGLAERDFDDANCMRIVFPSNHASAWISALNQARVTLGARWKLTEADMNRPFSKLTNNERDHDIFMIHLLATIEELFIENDDTWEKSA